MSEIKKIAVIGGGTMGNGIAHVFAMSGFTVKLAETKTGICRKGSEYHHKKPDSNGDQRKNYRG